MPVYICINKASLKQTQKLENKDFSESIKSHITFVNKKKEENEESI